MLPGTAASISGPASLLAWIFDGILGLPLALTFAFLAARFPDAGGVATFTSRAFGATWGAIVGWFYFFAATVAQAVVPLSGGYYIASALGWGRSGSFLAGFLLLALAVGANLYGLRLSGKIQLVLAGGVSLLLLLASIAALPHIKTSFFIPFLPHEWIAVGQSTVLLFFAFFGWEAIAQLSAEFKNPARDIVRSTIWSVIIVTILYVLVAFAIVGTGTYGTASQDQVTLGSLLASFFGGGFQYATALIALGTANAYVAATARLGHALGRDEAFPAWVGKLNAQGIPRRAVLVVGGLATAGMLGSYFFQWEPATLLAIPTSLGLATYLVGMAAGIRLLSSWKKLVAGSAFLFCCAVLPFAGASIFWPLLLATGAILYRQGRKISRRSLPSGMKHRT